MNAQKNKGDKSSQKKQQKMFAQALAYNCAHVKNVIGNDCSHQSLAQYDLGPDGVPEWQPAFVNPNIDGLAQGVRDEKE